MKFFKEHNRNQLKTLKDIENDDRVGENGYIALQLVKQEAQKWIDKIAIRNRTIDPKMIHDLSITPEGNLEFIYDRKASISQRDIVALYLVAWIKCFCALEEPK